MNGEILDVGWNYYSLDGIYLYFLGFQLLSVALCFGMLYGVLIVKIN